MSPDELEELLASMPTRTLSPTAEAEVLRAVATARPPAAHWWTRPVPLWQVGAACLLIALAAGLVGNLPGTESTGPVTPSAREPGDLPRIVKIVQPDKPLFGQPKSDEYALDIRRWQVNAAPRNGDQVQ